MGENFSILNFQTKKISPWLSSESWCVVACLNIHASSQIFLFFFAIWNIFFSLYNFTYERNAPHSTTTTKEAARRERDTMHEQTNTKSCKHERHSPEHTRKSLLEPPPKSKNVKVIHRQQSARSEWVQSFRRQISTEFSTLSESLSRVVYHPHISEHSWRGRVGCCNRRDRIMKNSRRSLSLAITAVCTVWNSYGNSLKIRYFSDIFRKYLFFFGAQRERARRVGKNLNSSSSSALIICLFTIIVQTHHMCVAYKQKL